MDIAAQRKIVAILKVLHETGQPLGSSAISRQLSNWGIDLQERMVRNYLAVTDRSGLTKNLGRRGRIITEQGQKELDIAVIIDKVGFVAARMDELAYRMNFETDRRAGTVILNISFIDADLIDHVFCEIRPVMQAKLGMGRHLYLAYPGETIAETNIITPPEKIAVATVCSVVLNGVLLRRGVAVTSRFGGLLELNSGIPVRFSQIINYDGSTLDPLEIFIKGKMTSVGRAAKTGTGIIGASFREVPTATLPIVEETINELEQVGLGGVLLVGKPNQPLLDIPVGYGRVGIIVAGGLNPIAAAEERGIETENHAFHTLCDFDRLKAIEQFDKGKF